MMSQQDRSQMVENLIKLFFPYLHPNLNKTASAPATPLMNKPRPAFAVRSSSISKQYESNTLPSEMPKKRRAPLPPMPASQSVPQDLAQSQNKPKIWMLKSSSVDETDKVGGGIERSGSLHLSGTSSVNSSLKRAKRKAPSPPSRKLQGQSDPSIDTGKHSISQFCTQNLKQFSDMGSEYSLKEIDEKEEIYSDSLSASEVPLDVQKHETASDSSFSIGDNAQESYEEKTENTTVGDNKEEIGKSNKPETLDDTSLNGVNDQKCHQINVDLIKTQDVAIQTPSEDNFGQTALSENSNHQGRALSPHKNSTHVHNPVQKKHSSGALNMMNKTIGQANQNSVNPNGTHDNAFVNDNQVLPETIVRSPVSSSTRTYPVYRHDSKPKPKPSNEITRDYIPKVGMTTYKIVPPKSLETAKNWELDHVEYQEVVVSPKNENFQEFGTQTEAANTSKAEPDFKNEVTLPEVGRDLPPKTYPDADHRPVSFSNAKGQKMEIEHPKPHQDHPIPPLILNSGSKSSPPAVQGKPKILSPPIRPSNFYLQIQRRTTDHYVTSAIARGGSLSSPIQNEAKTADTEKKVASPDQHCTPLPKSITVPSQLPEETTENGCNEERKVATSHVKVSQPLHSPSTQFSPLHLKTLRTFVLPQPYSSPKPSPFALAVSSAVKRSQSFSKTCADTTRPLKEQSSLDLSTSASSTEVKDHSPIPSPTTQQILTDKKTNDASYEQNRQAPPLFNHPATAICERSIAAAVQRPDPEQIHQSLLAAIRSGEAAAKLRRVSRCPPFSRSALNQHQTFSPI
uniref:Uncharacterized protein n=1 Tax=Laticauda laticaudata TaxID=8630 RepID=A0A8C5SEL3_LATLA